MINDPALPDLNIEPLGERVYYRSTNAVKSSGHLVSAAAEFAARMELGKDKIYGISSCLVIDSYRDSSPVVLDSTASVIIEGLGGYDNITAVNNCISRLRVDVKDMNKVSDEMLKKTGSLGIIKPSETHIQVIYGPKVEQVADAVRQVMKMYE